MASAKTSVSEKTDSTGSPQKKKFGLVLQGGGALGAYEAGAIKCLYERGMECTIVAGASSGAFNCGGTRRGEDLPAGRARSYVDRVRDPKFPLPDPIEHYWALYGVPHMYSRGWTTGSFRSGHTYPTTRRSRGRSNVWTGIRCAIQRICGCWSRRATSKTLRPFTSATSLRRSSPVRTIRPCSSEWSMCWPAAAFLEASPGR